MSNQMVVCNVYKLLKHGTKFTKEGKLLERSNLALSKDWVEQKNEKWLLHGKWYEILEDKTDEFYELKEQARVDRIETEKVEKGLKDALLHAVKVGAKVVEKEVDEIQSLRDEYEAKLGKKLSPRYMNDVEWIKSKLEENDK